MDLITILLSVLGIVFDNSVLAIISLVIISIVIPFVIAKYATKNSTPSDFLNFLITLLVDCIPLSLSIITLVR